MVIPSGSVTGASNTKNRIGIFGGSFDPPHVGHLIVALYALENLELDLLYVVPCYRPPHRENLLQPFEIRLKWLEKSFARVEKSFISDYESSVEGPSYSLHTVRHFSHVHNTTPYFIAGEDALSYIEEWYRYEELLNSCHFVVYPRYCGRPYEQRAKSVLKDMYSKILFLDCPVVQISSSEIRSRVRQGKSIRGMVVSEIESSVISAYSNE